MSAQDRRKHLERAVAEGGMIMTAKGQITRQVPSSTSLAKTPEEKRAARDDIERRYRQLQEEARLLEGSESDEEDEDFETGRFGAVHRSEGNAGERGGGDDALPGSIPVSARSALVEAGITSRSQLEALTDEELTAIKGIGQTSAARIREALK